MEEDLDVLFALHQARWPGSPWFADAEAFHRDFAALALERGWLRLWILELDGFPAGAWLGYRFAGVESYYQAGRDPAQITRSLGLYTLVGEDVRDLARRWERLRQVTAPGVLDGMSLDDYRQGHLVGTVEEVRAQLEEWESLGVSTFIVGLGAVSFAVTADDDVEMMAAAARL